LDVYADLFEDDLDEVAEPPGPGRDSGWCGLSAD
jgi:hypothetical protein